MPFTQLRNIVLHGKTCLFLFTLTLIIVSSGCEDDWDARTADAKGSIAFTISDSEEWQSRSGQQSEYEDSILGFLISEDPYCLNEDGDTVYVQIFEKEGIDMTGNCDKEESDTASVSRSTLVNNVSQIKQFYVKAASYLGEWTEDQTMNLMDNEPFAMDKSGLWRPSTNYLWPGGPYKTRFYAYYPQQDRYFSISDESGTPVLHYDTSYSTNTTDVVVAYSGEINGKPKTSPALRFKHILAGIRLMVSDNAFPGTLRSVYISGVYKEGDYDMSGNNGWTVSGETGYIYLAYNQAVDPAAEDLSLSPTVLFIPYSPNAQLEFNYKSDFDNTSPFGAVFLRSLSAGNTYTVKFSLGSSSKIENPTLSVRYDGKDIVSNNTEGTISIDQSGSVNLYKSIQISSSADINDATWPYKYCKYEFVEKLSNGKYATTEKPSWIKMQTPSVRTSGSVAITSIMTAVDALPVTYVDSEDVGWWKEDVEEQGSPDMPYYLEADAGSSNCYMVESNGYFSFPIVYGNTMDMYGGTSSAPYSNGNFVNYIGNSIKSAWIDEDTRVTPSYAKVLWQDAPDLITDVVFDDYTRRIEFTVKKENQRPGNAVVALYDSKDVIMWSWHLWVTPARVIYPSFTTAVGEKYSWGSNYQMMNRYLGECEPLSYEYAEDRSAILHIWLTRPNGKGVLKEAYITINQNVTGGTFSGSFNNAPSYQLGRKDPMRPISYNPGDIWGDKQIYSDDPDVWSVSQSTSTIANAIQTPATQYCHPSNTGNWSTYLHANSWNNSTTGTPQKTVYDPCPPGYRVPAPDEFELSSATIEGSVYMGTFYSYYMSWPSDDESMMNFPLTFNLIGNRSQSGYVFMDREYNMSFWTSEIVSLYAGGYLSVSYDNEASASYSNSGTAATPRFIRPITEEKVDNYNSGWYSPNNKVRAKSAAKSKPTSRAKSQRRATKSGIHHTKASDRTKPTSRHSRR